jgi:hypothetical protein
MSILNAAITRCFDLLFAPFAHANPWAGLVTVSALSGAVLLLIFRHTSNQRGLRAAKDRIVGDLLEVVLYRDELRVVLRAQLRVVRDNLRYLGHALVPLVFMVLPAAVLLLQIDLRYGRRPANIGEPVIVSVSLTPEAGPLDAVSLTAPPGVRVDSPALRIQSDREVDWRVVASAPGRHDLRIRAGGREFTKALVVGRQQRAIESERVQPALWRQFTHPGEAPLPSGGPVGSIRVAYAAGSLPFFRWRLFWIWPWLVLSMAFGYALRGPLRVQI